ncbi:MAG: type II toxin-antitoxin system HipA family toxin [Solirubrobacteraceae bacterium]|jgi:serine/threonine-protein kinase HipA
MSSLAEVRLWGTTIGAVSMDGGQAAVFQYDPAFLAGGIEVAPLRMALRADPYRFPALNPSSFHGLPGLLADSLPDRYGRALIDAWLAAQGRRPESFDSVERLCYVGLRGMGALEFLPARGPRASTSHDIRVDALVRLASEVLSNRARLVASLAAGHREAAMRDILSVGTSAGGARAKAVIAWNPQTGAVRSGQLDAGAGFEHWLLKLDGVSGNKDRERLVDPRGYGAIELAYAHMARDAAITMSECRLLEEGGRRHFMTRRFDRDAQGRKRHMQSLAALAHFDYAAPGAYSYEQAFGVIRELGLEAGALEQQFRRMAFNVVARNQDDHVKNIAFLMDRTGRWELSPAFDLAYSYNPAGDWTASHQMTLAGKRDGFTLEDFRQVGRVAMLKRGQAQRILGEVRAVVADWPRYAAEVGVAADHVRRITPNLRLKLPAR